MNPADNPREKDDIVFALLGRAAVNLSYLEFAVSEMLQTLLSTDEPIVSAIVAEEMSFAKRIQYIRKLTTFRFHSDVGTRERVLGLASRVDSYRSKRNLFVHGHWKFMATPAGVKISCIDYRWDIDPKGKRSRSRLREHDWTEPDLRSFIEEVRGITQEILDQRTELNRKMTNNAIEPYS